MKKLLSTMVTAGQLATNRPERTNQVNNMKIEQKVQAQKSIGIKKRYTAKRVSNQQMAGVKMRVKATAYYGDTMTSTGVVPKVGRTIAVDPKVIPYGTRVYIPQLNKVFIAEDCGGAIKGNRIDIFMNSYKECMEWGIKEIDIIILED